MDKKILFLRAGTAWKDPSPPMAFAYLGKIAKDAGFEVFVENLNAQYNTKTVEDVIRLIKKENPIVGISIFTNYSRDSYELIRKIRPYCKIIIAGGPHVTIYPEEAIKQGADISVVGEAEGMFKSLLDAIVSGKKLNNVKGIIYKEKEKIKKNPLAKPIDLEKLPLPDKDIFRKEDYMKTKEEINNFGGILSSRGCPGRCTYCFHSLFGRNFRYRSAESVFKEIKLLHEKYGITHINFIDDAFTINKKRLMDLCDMLIKARMPLEWVCATRIDFLDKEIIFKMKEAGCVMVSLGIEGCIPETLIKMGKTTNPEWYIKQSENVLKWCYEAKIRAGINILTGFPWDNAEDIKRIQRYVRKISRYVTQDFCGGILQPMPATEIYEKYAKEYGFENWWLNKKRIFEKNYHPFFMLYYHPFFEQLNNNFFNLNKDIFYEIDKLYKMMGQWNLKIISRRRFKNSLISAIVYQGLLTLSKMSLMLYGISPELEEKMMTPIADYSYRFKYKK
jgi:radical SAM superfamily enzyme YgiQ (UPF0313 family)